MGASQSSTRPSGTCATTATNSQQSKHECIRPYGVTQNSRSITLTGAHCTLYDGIVSLVKNNRYADLLIFCGNDRFPVHRAIVCPRSSFFEESCAAREGERDYASPARPTKIWIDPSECDPHILAAVLIFLYTLDYTARGPQILTFGLPEEVDPEEEVDSDTTLDADEASIVGDCDMESMATFPGSDPTPSPSTSRHSLHASASCEDLNEPPNELVFHVQVFGAAHRFGIIPLCDVVREKLHKRLVSEAWNVEMIECIREVYRQGGKLAALREIVVKSARSRFRVLKTCKGWDDLVMEYPEFAAEMLRRL